MRLWRSVFKKADDEYLKDSGLLCVSEGALTSLGVVKSVRGNWAKGLEEELVNTVNVSQMLEVVNLEQ